MTYLDEVRKRKEDIRVEIERLNEILKQKERLEYEMSGINIILETHRELEEPTPKQDIVSPKGKRLSPGVATEAFNILSAEGHPLTVPQIYGQMVQRDNIECTQNSVVVAMRRNPDHFKQRDRLFWEAISNVD